MVRVRRRGAKVWGGIAAASLFALGLLTVMVPSALAGYAYVPAYSANSVSVINTQTKQVVGPPISVPQPIGVAIAPDARTAYVVGSGGVSVINTQTNQVVGPPIATAPGSVAIAISPNGKTAYVTSETTVGEVTVINTQTRQVVGSITVGKDPIGVAVSPDGETLYVANFGDATVSVIDTATNQVVGPPIKVGEGPCDIAITPDGKVLYTANEESESVSEINLQTKQLIGSTPIGAEPYGMAVSPDGKTAYTTNFDAESISPIDTTTNQAGIQIPVGKSPLGIAITPDGGSIFVSDYGAAAVSVIGAASHVMTPVSVGLNPWGIAITPDQPPTASFSTPPRARPGVPLAFNASASSDADGEIAGYAWNFGDGQTGAGGPSLSHTYAAPGTYTASLTLTDNEGCSTTRVFTGQTAYCNGSALAAQTEAITVAYPGVRVKCPAKAKPKGCSYALQAVIKVGKGKHRHAKPESTVSRVRLKAGHSAVVSLKPKAAFRTRLAAATKILVRETVTIAGTRQVHYRKLKIVS